MNCHNKLFLVLFSVKSNREMELKEVNFSFDYLGINMSWFFSSTVIYQYSIFDKDFNAATMLIDMK